MKELKIMRNEVNRAHKAKTTLRYLLIVALVSLTSVLSATNVAAQNLAQRPEVQMKSTSGMVYSGSTLPQAAADGAYVTGSEPGTYTPASTNSGPSGRRKIGGGNSGGGDGPTNPDDPWATPLGDAAIPLALLALMYVCARAFLKKRA